MQVTSAVAEVFGQTAIGDVQELNACGQMASAAAAAVELSDSTDPDLERFEGMLVVFPQEMTVTGSHNLGHFGELDLSTGGRLFNPTNTINPNEPDNSAMQAAMTANQRRPILLDDATDRRNPDTRCRS